MGLGLEKEKRCVDHDKRGQKRKQNIPFFPDLLEYGKQIETGEGEKPHGFSIYYADGHDFV